MIWCSFWAAVATEALTLQDPKEYLVRALLPTVLRGLRIPSANAARYPTHLRDAACLVASALGMRSRLSSEAVSVLLEGAIMTCSSGGDNGSGASFIRGNMRSGILCAVAICRGQEVGSGGPDFPEALVMKLITIEGIGRELCALSTVYDVLPLLKPVLKIVVEKSAIFHQPSKLTSSTPQNVDDERDLDEQERMNDCAKEAVVPPPSYCVQWLRELSLQSGWSNDSLPSIIPWLTLEMIKQISTAHAPSPCGSSLANSNSGKSEKNSSQMRHYYGDSSFGRVNKSLCSSLLISLSQKYSEEVSAGVAAAAKASPEVGYALSEVLKDAMSISDGRNIGTGGDVYKHGTGLLTGGDLEHHEEYALGLSFATSLDGGCGGALPVPLFIALDHEDVAVRARALQAVKAAIATSHQLWRKNCRNLENEGDANASAQLLMGERRKRRSEFVWRWGSPLSSALLRRAADESPHVAFQVLGKRVLRDAVISVVSAANSAKKNGDNSAEAEAFAAVRCIVSRVCEWTRMMIKQRDEGGKEKRKEVTSALKGAAILMGCIADLDSNSVYHSPLEGEEADVGESIILQEPLVDLNTAGGSTYASNHPVSSDNGNSNVTISALALAALMELLPCALLCLWKDRKAAKKVGRATLSAISKLKRPHPMLLGLSAVEGGVRSSGGRSLEDQCVTAMASSPHIAEVSQVC